MDRFEALKSGVYVGISMFNSGIKVFRHLFTEWF